MSFFCEYKKTYDSLLRLTKTLVNWRFDGGCLRVVGLFFFVSKCSRRKTSETAPFKHSTSETIGLVISSSWKNFEFESARCPNKASPNKVIEEGLYKTVCLTGQIRTSCRMVPSDIGLEPDNREFARAGFHVGLHIEVAAPHARRPPEIAVLSKSNLFVSVQDRFNVSRQVLNLIDAERLS